MLEKNMHENQENHKKTLLILEFAALASSKNKKEGEERMAEIVDTLKMTREAILRDATILACKQFK